MRHDHHTGATYVRSRRADDNKQHMSQTVSSSFHRPVSRLVSTCLPTHIPAVFQPPCFCLFFRAYGQPQIETATLLSGKSNVQKRPQNGQKRTRHGIARNNGQARSRQTVQAVEIPHMYIINYVFGHRTPAHLYSVASGATCDATKEEGRPERSTLYSFIYQLSLRRHSPPFDAITS